MARLWGGGLMTALQAALGGVAGGLEGRATQRAIDDEKQRLAEAAARQAMLDSVALADKGFVEQGARREMARQTSSEVGNALMSLSAAGSGAGLPKRAPDFRMIQQNASQLGTTPAASVTMGGKTYERMQTPEAAALMAAEQEMARARRTRGEIAGEGEQRAAAAALAAAQQRAARKAEYKALGYNDREATMFADDPNAIITARGQDKSEATQRRGQDMTLKSARESIASKKAAEGEQGLTEVMSGLQAMGVARATSANNLIGTNVKFMEAFEDKVLAKTARVEALQLEAARIAMSGVKGAAIAEKNLATGIPGLMAPNPGLLRYVRAGKAIAGAVREITPRGGSNMMMQMETALSGIGPGGTDKESIEQVRAFRNDLKLGVQEGVNAMKGKPVGTSGGATPKPSTSGY